MALRPESENFRKNEQCYMTAPITPVRLGLKLELRFDFGHSCLWFVSPNCPGGNCPCVDCPGGNCSRDPTAHAPRVPMRPQNKKSGRFSKQVFELYIHLEVVGKASDEDVPFRRAVGGANTLQSGCLLLVFFLRFGAFFVGSLTY